MSCKVDTVKNSLREGHKSAATGALYISDHLKRRRIDVLLLKDNFKISDFLL